MSPLLTIKSTCFSPTDLARWTDGDTSNDFSENDYQALAICRDWLSGTETFVVHTSGSTGEPKPIVLRREQMVASARATGQALDLAAGDRALVCLPTAYIAGRMMLVRGLVLDLAMTLVEPSGDPFASLAPEARFDFMAVVPLQIQALLDGPPNNLERLDAMKAILVGGGPISATLEHRIRSLAAPVYHTYGMTETATHVALRRLNGPAASALFYPLPGVDVNTDERGCLRIKGPMTLDQWLQTNDLVELYSVPAPQRPIPAFRWLGRWDNIVNTGGVKVQVEQVEAALAATLQELDLQERRFFVGALPDDRLGQVVTAYIEGEPLGAEPEQRVQAALRGRLDRYAVPRRFVYLPRFVNTPTGKIDRQASLRRIED